MKTTAFTLFHQALGAKMVDFAGFQMPVYYQSIAQEHLCVRKAAGVFDVSHMGEFILKGKNTLSTLQKIINNDPTKLKEGQIQYACLMNPKGGIIDDLLVYCLAYNETYMLVVNASNIDKDFEWINQQKAEDVALQNISERTCLLAVQGPKAAELLQNYTAINLSAMPYYTFKKGVFAGIENVLMSNTGYTGAGGFEIYFEDKDNNAAHIWETLMKLGIMPIGLGARDSLRLEKGFCLYGNDIDENTSPLEAGLGWITRMETDFIGKDILLEQKKNGVTKKLVGFEIIAKGIPRKGYAIKNNLGEPIGIVTSGGFSPILEKGIGLGYVENSVAKVGNEIFIDIRNQPIQAKIVKLPFL